MGTPSVIVIEELNGKVSEVNVGNDGDIGYTGAMLYLAYDNAEKVKELISFGNISSLKKNIYPPAGVEHNQYNYDNNTTLFYKRDFGRPEEGRVRKYDSLNDYFMFQIDIVTYVYKESEARWYYLDIENSWKPNGEDNLKLIEDGLKSGEIYFKIREDVKTKIVTREKNALESLLNKNNTKPEIKKMKV